MPHSLTVIKFFLNMNPLKYQIGLGLIVCLSLVFSCNTSKSAKNSVALDPYMTFETPLHDFGTIKKGEKKMHIFKFTNTGKEDIAIELVSGCHCTELEWPEMETFKPGESGEIKAIFDSMKEEDLGPHEKVIDILLVNTNSTNGYQIIKEAKYKLVLIE